MTSVSSRKSALVFAGLVSFLFLVVASLWQLVSLDAVSAPPEMSSPPAAASEDWEEAVVTRVIDGDTIELADGRTVRYIGIDTPETKHPTKGQECYGQEASQRNEALVLDQTVYLEPDVSQTDRFGRLLRYVWVGDVLINEQLVAEGLAYAASFPPDVKRQDQFRLAQAQAAEASLGLWGVCDISADRQPAVLGSETPPAGCDIKGNISDRGHLYHLPGCGSYNQVKILVEKGERWFCSEAEATAAGWVKAGTCP